MPDHIITMQFDMTTSEGRTAFEYARLGANSHLVIWELWNQLHRRVNGKDGFDGEDEASQLWLHRLLDIMDEHGVPLEVE